MRYEWMSAQDATLRSVEADESPLLIGALCFFEGGPLRDSHGRLRLADLRRLVERALVRTPRLRQVILPPPFGAGRSVWVDHARFDIADHVRAAALPRPGGPAELREFVRRLLETPLDRSRPLWELWIVDGVEGDRVAIMPKTSHVAADGVALLTFALSLLDDEPHDGSVPPAEPWTPEPAPNRAALLVRSVVDGAFRPLVSLERALAGIARPDRLAARAAGLATAARQIAARAPRMRITRPVGPHRDFVWASVPMAGLKATAHAHQVKLNDVVLTVVAEALAAGMARAGEPVDGVRPRALVPVSTHGPGAAEDMHNAFSLMVADLPVGPMTPAARLDLVHLEMQRCKSSAQTGLGPMLFAVGALVPAPVLHRLASPALRHQPFVNLAVTNLAGSPVPLYLLGSRMLGVHPFISSTGNVGLIIGVLSHDGQLCVGITADPDFVDGIDTLADDIVDAAAALVDSAG